MNRVVSRIKKLKYRDLQNADNHNRRKTPQRNITQGGKHYTAYERYENVSLQEALELRISEIPESERTKITKQGTHATAVVVEFVVSATPTYFRDDADAHGVYDEKKTNDWINANVEFLKEKYSDNLLNIHVHLDEKTPHIHAEVVPIVKKERNRRRTAKQKKNNESAGTYTVQTFDAKSMFNKFKLIELQDEFAKAVEHLDIKRGVKKSKVKNTPMKALYKIFNKAASEAKIKAENEAEEIKLRKPSRLENLTKYVESEESRLNKYSEKIFKTLREAYIAIAKLKLDLSISTERNERYASFFNDSLENADKKLDEIESTISKLEHDRDTWKAKFEYEKFAHESTQKELDSKVKHIEKIEELSDNDKMLYRMNKAMQNKNKALSR